MNLRENKVRSTLEELEEGKGENAVIIFSFQKLFQWLKKKTSNLCSTITTQGLITALIGPQKK